MQKEIASHQDISRKIIEIEDLKVLKLSKDGSKVFFSSSKTGSYQIWSKDIAGGAISQVSHGGDRVEWVDIFPDSKRALFSRDFSGSELHQFFIAPVSGKEEERQISDLKGIRVGFFGISPHGDRFAFDGATRDANSVYLYDLKTNEYRAIYSQKDWVFAPQWRKKDGKLLVAPAKTTSSPTASELLFIEPETGRTEIYTPKEGSDNEGVEWHPSKNKVMFRTNAKDDAYDIAVFDLDSRSVDYLGLSSYGFDFPGFGWMHNEEDGIWFVAQKNGRSRLYLRSNDGSVKELKIPTGTISGAELDEQDRFIIFSWSSLSSPPQISKIDLPNGNLSDVYSTPYDRTLPLGSAEFLKYRSFDGLEIPSFLLRSKERGDNAGPSVVWPHGGPWWQVADEWNAAIQAICAAGYHVMCPNFRGSTGYGAKFQFMDIKDAGGADMQDVLLAAKYLRDHNIVEDGKIAIAGASYGGFMTFLVMTKVPDAFKAGAAIVGITDWEEMYSLSDAAYRSFVEMLFGGKPEGENLSLYKDRSAINFVSQVMHPIFIWHRGNDSRCPLVPIEKFVAKMKELGKPCELHVTQGEGHGHQKVENLARQYAAVISFLDREIGSER